MDPVELLNFAIDELGHTQAELGELLGSRSRASEILNRKRALTLGMIRTINAAWKLPVELLIKPYELRPLAA
jgi:HTH-type transcriptional regulator/antitoxin HigA